MAIDCNQCDRKTQAKANDHCEEFHLIPQLDECQMHSKFDGARKEAAEKAAAKIVPQDRPGYIWLTVERQKSSVKI